jgi:hypothetical protein
MEVAGRMEKQTSLDNLSAVCVKMASKEREENLLPSTNMS